MKNYQRAERLYKGRSDLGPSVTMGQKLKDAFWGFWANWCDDTKWQNLKLGLIVGLCLLAYMIAGTIDFNSGVR